MITSAPVRDDLAVPCRARVAVRVTGPLRHRCPYRRETDLGTVTIDWTTDGHTLELHGLRAWLDLHTTMVISHEEITARLRRWLSERPGVADVEVYTSWVTAGLSVIISDTRATDHAIDYPSPAVSGALPDECVVRGGA